MSLCKDFARKAKHRIAVQEYTQTVDAYGSPVNDWATVETVWAYIKPLSGSEQFTQEQLQATATHRFTVRYKASLEGLAVAQNRVVWDSRNFNIRSVKNVDTENQFLEIMAEEGVDS